MYTPLVIIKQQTGSALKLMTRTRGITENNKKYIVVNQKSTRQLALS